MLASSHIPSLPAPESVRQSALRTEAEIRAKLAFLRGELANFSDENQALRVRTDIQRLLWVLGEGPDVIIVPKPAPRARYNSNCLKFLKQVFHEGGNVGCESPSGHTQGLGNLLSQGP
jgi:hypothetical protein